MSAPKKPHAVKTAPAPELTAAQLRAAQQLALMCDEAQAAMLKMIADMAKACPRHQRPALRLISGGAE